MADPHKSGVIGFYDTHPINEDEILAKLVARGIDVDRLTQAQLKDFDQDHYGGIDVVDTLARQACIRADHRVLDICSGMGGPARWIATTIGCRVTGLDFTQSRVEAARRLTQRVGLSDRVDFVTGDATAMPLPDAAFDVAISQEAWLHVPDKPALIAQCARVLRPAGVLAFTDVVLRQSLTAQQEARMATDMHAPGIGQVENYLALLADNGLQVAQREDLSAQWTAVLVDRLAMYRGLRDTTVAKFGADHYQRWDDTYSFFVGLFVAGKLGGTRIVAHRIAA